MKNRRILMYVMSKKERQLIPYKSLSIVSSSILAWRAH